MIAPGQKLGRYLLREPLGSGGMSCVYRAYDPALDREVALKILSPELSRDATSRERFEEEARALGRVEHPNLVRIFAVGQAEDVSYYAMELVHGMTLQQILKSGVSLTLEESAAIVRQMLLGLQAAHDAGIIHRDIKPGNIMLEAGGRVILMDFGLARRAERQSIMLAGSVLGTPEYMSPEQIMGKPAEMQSDLYSTGVLLYELLSGAPPFTGKDTISILRRHVEEPPRPLIEKAKDAPEPVARITHRLLEKNPPERYPHVRALLADLARAVPEIPKPEAMIQGVLARATRVSGAATRTMAGTSEISFDKAAKAKALSAGRYGLVILVTAAVTVIVMLVALTAVAGNRIRQRREAFIAAPRQVFRVTPFRGEPFEGVFLNARAGAEGEMIYTFRLPDGSLKFIRGREIRRIVREKGGEAP